MKTTPYSFYELFVYPNYEDYVKLPGNVRLGFNAALSAFQMTDIFLNYYQRENPDVVALWSGRTGKKKLLEKLCENQPHFLTIQSVATVYKHLYVNDGFYTVGSPAALWGVRISDQFPSLEYDCEREDVIVSRTDGSQVSLRLALEEVVESMWPDFLEEHTGSLFHY